MLTVFDTGANKTIILRELVNRRAITAEPSGKFKDVQGLNGEPMRAEEATVYL